MRINREMSKVDEAGMICAFVPAVDQVDEFHLDCLAPGKCQKIIGFQKFTRIGGEWSSLLAKSVRVRLPRLLFRLPGFSEERGRGGVNVSGLMPANPLPPHAQIFFPVLERFFQTPALSGRFKASSQRAVRDLSEFLGEIVKFQHLSSVIMLSCHWARIPQAENLHFDLHTRSFFPMKCVSDVRYNSSVLGRWSFSNHWHRLFSVLSRLSLCFFRGSKEHSQMVATLYPLPSARSMFLLSRSVLSLSFFAHLLSASPRTLAAFLQPGC